MINLSFILYLWILATTSLLAKDVKRSVLALWDSHELTSSGSMRYTNTKIHMHAELILNHLGLKLDYIDLAKGIPKNLHSSKFMNKYDYIITWFSDDSILEPVKYIKWLERQHQSGKKILLLGQLGFLEDNKKKEVEIKLINSFLNKIGFKITGSTLGESNRFSPVFHRERKDSEFERDFRNEMGFVLDLMITDNKRIKKWTSARSDILKREIPVAFSFKNGAFASSGYEIFMNPNTFSTQWRINPYEFFTEAFGIKPFPVPDTTTRCGKRIFYSHIDGDGFINVSGIDKKSLSAKIIKDEIIDVYKVGIGVSVIVAEISPKFKGNAEAMNLAKSIFQLENVEAASHTYTHPLSWSQNPTEIEQDTYLGAGNRRKGPIVAYPVFGNKLDYKKETLDSLNFINKELTQENKKTKTLYWSGSCIPPLAAIELLEKKGYLHLNGGDSRFDSAFPSLGKVAPIYRKVGRYTQVYASTTNENLFTNLWSENYGGFSKALETFQNTEAPNRVKPINIYYHFYSGEKLSSLKALKKLYDWSVKQNINPVYPSEFIKIARDFEKVEIEEIKEDNFRIKNLHNLKTLRMKFKYKYPDLKKSENILGYKLVNKDIYFHIGKESRATLVLSSEKPVQPYVEECNGNIESISINKENKTVHTIFKKPNFLKEGGVIKNLNGFTKVSTGSNEYNSSSFGEVRF
jgi:hypothetical protein